jgi:hypothetical protein
MLAVRPPPEPPTGRRHRAPAAEARQRKREQIAFVLFFVHFCHRPRLIATECPFKNLKCGNGYACNIIGNHCYGCTAGAGSSCGGSLAETRDSTRGPHHHQGDPS